MIPLIQKEICDKKGWIDEDTLLDMIAISESTPGPVAINVATFVANGIYIDSRLAAGMECSKGNRIAAATSYQLNANINRRRLFI